MEQPSLEAVDCNLSKNFVYHGAYHWNIREAQVVFNDDRYLTLDVLSETIDDVGGDYKLVATLYPGRTATGPEWSKATWSLREDKGEYDMWQGTRPCEIAQHLRAAYRSAYRKANAFLVGNRWRENHSTIYEILSDYAVFLARKLEDGALTKDPLIKQLSLWSDASISMSMPTQYSGWLLSN